MKKICLLLMLIIFTVCSTTGCWNRRELNRLAIVSAMGIDKTSDGRIKLTAQIVRPSAMPTEGSSGDKKSYYILTSSGDTVFDALRNFLNVSGRKLYHPHSLVIVLGNGIAKEGILPVLDLFVRDMEFRLLTWVVITDKQASEIIGAESPVESIPAQHIDLMLKEYGALSKTVALNMLDLYKELTDQSIQPVIGKLDTIGFDGKMQPVLDGSGVFKGDKLIGTIKQEQTRGYLWVRNKVKGGIIVVQSPVNKDQKISLEIKHAATKLKPTFEDGKLSCEIEIKVDSDLGEQMGSENLVTPEMFQQLEEAQSTVVENEVNGIVNLAQQKFGVDILGVGDIVWRKLPKQWKQLKDNWEEEFPNVPVTVRVDSEVKNFGLLKNIEMKK